MAVYAIVDGARDSRIYDAVRGTFLLKECLYSGDLPLELQKAAPYLVQLEREDRFTRFLIEKGWGDSWTTFVHSDAGIKQLRRHLRKILRVRDEGGRRLIFRYYDPACSVFISRHAGRRNLKSSSGQFAPFLPKGK